MDERPTILIVDDDAAMRQVLRAVLIAQGYRLIEAEDGPAALQAAQEHTPDLVLLDVMMPGMDGYEVCRRLRADPVLGEVPVMMITALDDRDSRIAGIEAGADDFISKPYDRVELRARVRTITRLNRYRSLLMERARFVWVIDNETEAYLMLDNLGIVHYANTAAREMFSLPPAEDSFPEQPFLEYIGPSFNCVPPERWQGWLDRKDDQESSTEPLYLVRPQTEYSQANWLEVRVLNLPWGNKDRLLVRVQDVTETMAMKLETWSFQAAAHHKLKTPISSVLMSLQIMNRMVKNSGSPQMLEMINEVELGARRLESEIKDILQYINAPRIAQSGEFFSLSQLEPLLQKTAQELEIESVRFLPEYPGLLDLRILLSNQAMQVVLWETLENSKKFHPRHTPQVNLCLAASGPDELSLQIIDDGVTLSPLEIGRALTPYYQAENAYSGEVSGMGLGLSTVAALVWQIGGGISLYNRQPGPGVVVHILLPVERKNSI